jgi:hypothetical protein
VSSVAAPWVPITLVVPIVYAGAVVLVSLTTSKRNAFRLIVVFPTMHMSWAWGFLARKR